MKIVVTCFFFILMTLCGNAFAGQFSEIELVDGGIILGEVISHSDGIYIVRSNSLGTLKVKESEIRLIRLKYSSSKKKEIVSTPGGTVSPDMQALQKSMMDDKEVMGQVMSLQKDPKMQALLKDPEFMKAINSGDISTLMANPKFIELLNNPEIREIQKTVLKPNR
ncbi:MAG TPA: hypothetical protein HPP59_02860 [Deltaproteobacteria bacterium]|nr:hypothetical protein [Deltaproteobacteria bacterium]HIJ40459.1 hypothetical protein [Deltaproteobacteria bacterium]